MIGGKVKCGSQNENVCCQLKYEMLKKIRQKYNHVNHVNQ